MVLWLCEQHPEGVKVTDKEGRLPLHLAAEDNSNVEVVRCLWEQHPEGVRVADEYGRLPLHWAAGSNSNVKVVRWLWEQHPEGVRMADKEGSLPLHLAARYNSNVKVVRWLWEQHPDGVKVADKDGRLPLHWAAGYNNNVEVVRWLWEQHPEAVMVADKEGLLSLHLAAGYNSNVELVRWLWEQHPEAVRVADKEGRLPLHLAAGSNSNVEVVRWLWEQHPEAVRVTDKEGRLPLHWAAGSNSNVEVVRLLCEQHPDGVKVVDKWGSLPLHLAASDNSNVGVVRWLWEQHLESVRAADEYGRLPLHWAAANKINVKVFRWLWEQHPEAVRVADKEGLLPLLLAAGYNSNVEVVRWLWEQHPEGVKVVDKWGRLPLHLAAGSNRNVEVVRWVWEQHPEAVIVVDKWGRLPFHWAAANRNSNVEVVRWLWEQHPKGVRVTDMEGRLPLHLAAANNSNVEVVRWLWEQHPEAVRVADKEGRLPMHLAAAKSNSNVEMIRWLWEQHPDGVKVADKEGRLPLHLAARYNSNVEVVRWLWEQYLKGVRVADKEGRLPLHLAARDNSNVEVVRWLWEQHPDGVKVADKEGRLPLHLAARDNRNVEVVRWLWEQHPDGVKVADKGGSLPLHLAANDNGNVEVVRLLLGDGRLYFERSVSFVTQEVVRRLRFWPADKLGLHDIVGNMVDYASANPHCATCLRAVFDYDMGLFNLQKGFKGAYTRTRLSVNVHVCGEKLAGKTTLSSWLQKKLQKQTTWLDRASTLVSRPAMAELVGYHERTPGLLIHRVDNPQEVEYVLHDYGGHEEFRKVYRQFLNVPQSIYVVVLPLVEKRSDTEHRAYSAEEVVSQYRQWLGQIHNALQGASQPPPNKTAVITLLNQFSGVLPEAEMPNRSKIEKLLEQCQETPALASTFAFYPCVTVDCRNEHDVMSVCTAIETWVSQQRALPDVRTATTAASFPVVEYLRDSFDRDPIASQFVEETEYQAEVRRRLLNDGYREEDELPGSLDLLVRWWVADSLRARRILRLSPGPGKEDIIVTSVDALSHWLFGKVLNDMRERSAKVIDRAEVRRIVGETIAMNFDAAELLVDVGLFTRITAYDAVSGQVETVPPSAAASDDDLFLVIGLISQRVGAEDMRPPEFRAETTRRIHRWYTLDPDKAVDWGPDFFVTLCQCVMSLVPSCRGPLIFKDAISATAEDGQRYTTYIVRPHRHKSLGVGFEVIVDVSTDLRGLTFQDIMRKDDVVWRGLQAINATCRRLVGGEGLREYCVYPDPRFQLAYRWVVDVENALKKAEAHGQNTRFQLQKYLYGYYPLEGLMEENSKANLPLQLVASVQLQHGSIEQPVEDAKSLHRLFSETIVQMVQEITKLQEACESATAAAAAAVAVTSPLAVVDRSRLLAMESTLNNLYRAQLNNNRGMCDFPLLVFLEPAKAQFMGVCVPSIFTKQYRVCCVCPVCGEVAQSDATYVLRVSKGKWHRYLLRALQVSMVLAGVALKAAGVPTLAADALYGATTTILSDVSKELSKELGTLVDAYRNDVTSAMVSRMEDVGEATAAAVAEPPSNATAAAVNTIGQEPLDRERRVSWEFIRAMKALFTESLRDPEAARSGLARIWSDDGDVAFVCADASRGCRERFRRDGRKCLRVVAVYGG